MPLLTNKKQLAAAIEITAGTVPTLNAATATTLPSELGVSTEIDKFTRDFVRDSATALKENVGKKTGTITFKAEMKGTTSGAHGTAPNFSKFLQGVGFEEVEIQSILIGAIAGGPFRHGELVTQTSSAARAVVFMDTHDDAPQLFVDKNSIVGTIDGTNAWTGFETGATATPTAVAVDEGMAWRLITVPLKTFTLTADWSGVNPVLGDVIEGNTSGARGIFESDDAAGIVQYRELRGEFSAGETIGNLTQDNTPGGTLHGTPALGYVYGGSMSQRVHEDGLAVTIAGARGNMSLEFEVNRPVMMAFEFRGVLNDASDIVNLTGISYDYGTPPLWAGAISGFADNEGAASVAEGAEQDPCMRTLTIDLGAQLADRECAGAVGGLKEVIISNRDGTFSMDPEATPDADIPWMTNLQSGDVMRLRVPVGASDGNRFTIFTPGLQLDGNDTGDRDGLMTREVSGKLTGGNLNNLNGTPANLSTIGGDNEIVIIYHTQA